MAKGTIAIEEAVINPESVEYFGRMIKYLDPGSNQDAALQMHAKRLSDIHEERLKAMDSEGVEYMLLSVTSPGCQGEHDVDTAEKMATQANNWLSAQGMCMPTYLVAEISAHM
jgi:2,3-dihydroxybenzoate decarboxylase